MGGYTNNANTSSSEYLYDPSIIAKLNFSKCHGMTNPPVTATDPGERWLIVRPLQRGDYDKGFLQLLGQLTSVGNVTRKEFDERFTKMKSAGSYYVTVIEDTRSGKIIGAATLTVEQKFIHGCGSAGRLEDVVVDNTYRGKQLGKLIVTTVSALAEYFGVYKLSLECKDTLIAFYKSLGYTLRPGNGNAMRMSFEPS